MRRVSGLSTETTTAAGCKRAARHARTASVDGTAQAAHNITLTPMANDTTDTAADITKIARPAIQNPTSIRRLIGRDITCTLCSITRVACRASGRALSLHGRAKLSIAGVRSTWHHRWAGRRASWREALERWRAQLRKTLCTITSSVRCPCSSPARPFLAAYTHHLPLLTLRWLGPRVHRGTIRGRP